jgi:hypothetical protein
MHCHRQVQSFWTSRVHEGEILTQITISWGGVWLARARPWVPSPELQKKKFFKKPQIGLDCLYTHIGTSNVKMADKECFHTSVIIFAKPWKYRGIMMPILESLDLGALPECPWKEMKISLIYCSK